ncbi:integrase family protein [Roseomonas frigidaquae]|uniref:Integrase family protein n=1 Tax=Falsiroseomonas frigidaquae TaxID=487318 RepID=A0ABX1F155_9PROT|nr:integrase family protein [Falsiroseomonas frigidaquae]NKE46077.1 integrase family protein [Falsiroseomonas frigidaquae]
MPQKLTDKTVAALTCPAGKKDLWVTDSELRGFTVRVQPSGVRTFLFNYRFGPRVRRAVLGTFGAELTTAKARDKAERLRGILRDGRDPLAEREAAEEARVKAEAAAAARAAEAAFTVKSLVDLYAEKHVAGLRPATQRDVLSRLRLHLGPIADRPAMAIGRRDAAAVVDKAAEAGETTARRVRDYARAMWAWALRRGTLPEGAANPWEHAPAPGRDVPRERVLGAEEVGHVWRAAGTLAAPYGPMVRFTLLTLARREEVTAMAWGEVAPDLSAWTQPGTRTKNGKAHVVHLAEPARAILRALLGAEDGKPLPALPKADRLVFGIDDKRPITTHSWVKREIDSTIAEARAEDAAKAGQLPPEPMPGWVLHDFRRSGVTWLAGAGFPPHVADRLLNHVQGTIRGVAAIYQRGEFLEERKAALAAWAAHVEACGEGRGALDNVAVLAERRRA